MKVFLFEALWLMFLLRLPGLAWCVVQESRFHAVCGSAASALSPLPCARKCAQDPLCAGFEMSPCELLLNISCTEGKETFEKQVPSTQGPSTQGPSTQGPSTHGPSTQGPSTQGPSIQGPSTQGPSTQEPPSQGPSTPCPAPFAYEAEVNSCYSIHVTTAATPVEEHQSMCESLHPDAHLIAVETAAEHEHMRSIPGIGWECKYTWSCAYMETPHAGQTSNWTWDLGTGGLVSQTFMAWKSGQPDNQEGDERHIVLEQSSNYEWVDVLSDLSLDSLYTYMCAVCEYDP